MPKLQVELDTDLPFTEFIDPDAIQDITSSRDFRDGNWRALTAIRHHPAGVSKSVIPVDFSKFCMLVVTRVSPNTRVPSHSHAEGIVRYIISGSLTLNGVKYQAGDWILAPNGTDYEIETKEGYVAIAGYLQACTG